jgi:ribonuclease P protein component
VRREGKRIRTEHLEVRALASLLPHPGHPRVGFVVPRYKHTAVERNLLKRRLREIARTRLVPVLPPGDVVIKVLPHAYGAPFDALGRQLERVVDRIAQATREPRRAVAPDAAS